MGSLGITLASRKEGDRWVYGFMNEELVFEIECISGTEIKFITFAPMIISRSKDMLSTYYGSIEFVKRSGKGRILARFTAPRELEIIRAANLSFARGEGLISISNDFPSKKNMVSQVFLSFGQTLERKLDKIYFDFV